MSDALCVAVPKMDREAIWTRGVMSGRFRMFVAMNPDRKKEIIVRRVPIKNSKVIDATMMFLSFLWLFWCLYWAVYFIVAWSIPRSRMTWIKVGAVRAIPTKPYSPSCRIPATTITDMEEIIEERAIPQKR